LISGGANKGRTKRITAVPHNIPAIAVYNPGFLCPISHKIAFS